MWRTGARELDSDPLTPNPVLKVALDNEVPIEILIIFKPLEVNFDHDGGNTLFFVEEMGHLIPFIDADDIVLSFFEVAASDGVITEAELSRVRARAQCKPMR